MDITIKIIPNETGNPTGKLADAALLFGPSCGMLDGLRLVGFGVWESRTTRAIHITFPARKYRINGEQRSFALLRPRMDGIESTAIRDAIIDAYADYKTRGATHTAA